MLTPDHILAITGKPGEFVQGTDFSSWEYVGEELQALRLYRWINVKDYRHCEVNRNTVTGLFVLTVYDDLPPK